MIFKSVEFNLNKKNTFWKHEKFLESFLDKITINLLINNQTNSNKINKK